jgi:hypothetical protein
MSGVRSIRSELAKSTGFEENEAKTVLEDFRGIGLIPEKWTVEKCSSAQVKGAEGNEEKSVQ